MLGLLVVLSANFMTYRKKLIEVSMPLEAINQESAREKSIRHGHPSTLHLWWARRPLAACRAVLFASLVDDPSAHPDKFPTEEEQQVERQRLHDLIGKIETVGNKQIVRGLVSWDDIKTDESGTSPIIEAAQKEIARCLAWENNHEPPTEPEAVSKYLQEYAPPVYDPFCGGGSIPLEAQRLGIEAHGSDLNPVAVLSTKALIEIPPKFKDKPPVNPEAQKTKDINQWRGAQGLAEDVRYYGKWMRDEAQKRIGHLYPQVELPPYEGKPKEHGSGKATVIAWLWARTVKCPNPACGCQMPLVRSFELSKKKGKEAWVEPIVDNSQSPPVIKFEVKSGEGKAPEPSKTARGANFRCLACEQPVDGKHIKAEGKAGRMDAQLMAIVAEGKKGRIYLSPTLEHEKIAKTVQSTWYPDGQISDDRRSMFTPLYGLTHFHHLFTSRQLVALTTFSDLVKEVREKIKTDAATAGMTDDNLSLNDGGTDATAYADAVVTYLAFAVDRCADYWCSIATWHNSNQQIRCTFARQAIPMTWDYIEANPFSNSSGGWISLYNSTIESLQNVSCSAKGIVTQIDAATSTIYRESIVVSTDPPYYDNIGYADLSDFFYIWLRRSLSSIYPDLFRTLLVPKEPELVATPHRFGGSKQKAKEFFETGLNKAFKRMRNMASDKYPLTIYYAFKQTETDNNDKNNNLAIASTGWETMLEGLMRAGFSITGTLPMRSEQHHRMIAHNTNALASSIALVCRPRLDDAPSATRRQFLKQLQTEFPTDLKNLQQGNIAPVDLAQASIGLGMSVFSRYSKVLEADGNPMRVRTALQIINSYIDEFLNEQEGEFDPDTRWALTWFEQYQFEEGQYGDAETLSKAKNTSIKGLKDVGILVAKHGKARLLKREEMFTSPPIPLLIGEGSKTRRGSNSNDWEATQHLIQTLDKQGETGAAILLAQLGDKGEVCRDLAYRLYVICDRQSWTQEAISYNSLVTSWSEISRLAAMEQQSETIVQGELVI
jgi:putative DNA methylase